MTLLCASSIIRAPARTADEPPDNSAISRLLAALANGDLDLSKLAAPHELDRHGPPNPLTGEQHEQVVCVLDGLAVQRRKDVPDYEATTPSGAAFLDADDEQSAPLRQPEMLTVR